MIEKPVQLGNQQMGSTVKDNSMASFLGNHCNVWSCWLKVVGSIQFISSGSVKF